MPGSRVGWPGDKGKKAGLRCGPDKSVAEQNMRRIATALVGLAGMLGGCFPCPACVTADIDGVIIDEVSKEPVSGAAISATEYPEVNALSDEEGRFYLGHKTDLVWVFFIGDSYTVTNIRIEKEGYRTKSVEVFGWLACGPEEVTVELEARDGG